MALEILWHLTFKPKVIRIKERLVHPSFPLPHQQEEERQTDASLVLRLASGFKIIALGYE
jgi:hypothetical protein